MPFQECVTRVPESIGTLRVELHDRDGTLAGRSIFLNVHVLDDRGKEMDTWSGNPIPHLTLSTIELGDQFLDALRAEAISSLIPGRE